VISKRKSPLTVPLLVVLLGLMASVFTWHRVSAWELLTEERRMGQRAWEGAQRLQDAVALEAESLRMLAAAAEKPAARGEPPDLAGQRPLPATSAKTSTTATASAPERALRWAAWCRPLTYGEVLQLELERGPAYRVHTPDGRPVRAPGGDDSAAERLWVLDQIAPPELAAGLEGLEISSLPGWERAVEEALATGELALSQPRGPASTDVAQTLLAAMPIEPGKASAGVIVGELAVQPLIDRAFAPSPSPYEVPVHAVVLDHGVLLGSTSGPEALPGSQAADSSLPAGGRKWTIELHPAASRQLSYVEWLDRTSVVLPGAVFVVMCLVSWVVWLQQRQTFEIRKQVAHQTATLRRQNMDLEDKERQLEESNRRLHEISNTDPLTGLLNRRGFEVQLDRERERSRRTGLPCGLLFFDVDHFKGFNDRYGHAAGDEVLRRVAQLMNGEARRIDCVARYGGEEFVILASATDAGGLITLAERVRGRVESAGIANEASPLGVVTVSGGGAFFGGPLASDVRAVFDLADRCLYQAKSTGRNRVVMVS
jgi:diguanylate cyclase (GGDEF)-like protein